MSTENLINEAIRSIVDGDEDAATKIANTVIAEGINPIGVINDGFAKGMIKVGDLFANEEYSLPEVLLSAEAMQKAIDLLTPHIPGEEVKKN
jgi:trimethylamine corrinoid protein